MHDTLEAGLLAFFIASITFIDSEYSNQLKPILEPLFENSLISYFLSFEVAKKILRLCEELIEKWSELG